MKEYYVAHSKWKTNGKWDNCLTFSPKKDGKGIYTYYHCGDMIWQVEDSDALFKGFDSFVRNMEYIDNPNKYPVYKKYSDDCQKRVNFRFVK